MQAVENQSSGKLVVGIMYFSPSGNTKKVCEEVAKSISPGPPIQVDVTKPSSNGSKPADVDLWVIGAPVYSMRLPAIARERISKALDKNGKKTPAVAVSVYGNVGMGIGLKQLVNLLSEKGYKVIGAGGFIGEHTLSKTHGGDTPYSVGRPNDADMAVAKEFAAAVLKKGINGSDISSMEAIQAPKLSGMLARSDERGIKSFMGPFELDQNKCNKCKICVKTCPVNCIDDTIKFNTENCIYCANCIKVCPTGAISQKNKHMWLLKLMLRPDKVYNKPVFYT